MTDKEYRAAEGISHSQLVKLKDSPEKFKYLQEHSEEPTESLIFGQAFHMYVLQRGIFNDNFVVAPECNKHTTPGKKIWNDFCESSQGKTIITLKMLEQIEEMTKKLLSNKYVRILLNGAHEKEFFWTDKQTGERCKCRVDTLSLVSGQRIIVDLKSADNAELGAFMRRAIDYNYHTQAAYYIDGVEANINEKCDFVFIAIEKKPPYAINIMQADDLFLKYGLDEYHRLLNVYHDCKINDNWYGYNGKDEIINILGLPVWLAKEVEFLYGV